MDNEKRDATRAIFEAVTLMALVDGRPDLSEARVVSELIQLDPRFADLEDAFELAVKTRVLLDEKGLDEALVAITTPIVTEDDRRLAFTLCVRVMIADGKTEGAEAMALGTLQELFALSPEQVRACVDAERERVRPA